MVTKMDKGSKWTWQWGQGPTCHIGHPTRALPGATLSAATSSIHGSYSRSIFKRPFKSICTEGRDEVIVDPPAHCHRLGGF